MYRIEPRKKNDPAARWGLPDKVFFACGACHILAYAFLERYGFDAGKAIWIKPEPGFTGNHIVVAYGQSVFDYHGHSTHAAFMTHMQRKAQRWWPGWRASFVELAPDVLISETKSRAFDGL